MKMPGMGPRPHDVEIPSSRGVLTVARQLPDDASGLVVMVHAEQGKARNGARVQRALADAGLATVRFTAPAGENGGGGVTPLAGHVLEVIDWIGGQDDLAPLPLGLFATGLGAGAALLAAAQRAGRVGAVVAPGGRPDLAGEALAQVDAPTLLIVGGEDHDVLDLNRSAMRLVRAECELQIVPGAGRRFEEPGAGDTLVDLTREWFQRYLARALGPEPPRKPREGGGT
jgi:putative phosphoribosyl transferase